MVGLIYQQMKKLGKIFKYLVPKDDTFFPVIEQDVENLVRVAEVLKQLIGIEDLETRDITNCPS